MNWKRIILNNKNNKLFYYINSVSKLLIPAFFYRNKLVSRMSTPLDINSDFVKKRVSYYNKLQKKCLLTGDSMAIKDYKLPDKIRVYFFDSILFLRYFNKKYRFKILPGDITYVPNQPSLVKSRPIGENNENSVLLKLDKTRHFNFIKDEMSYRDKKNILVGRSGFHQEHRARFYNLYKKHPLCNLKKATRSSDVGFLSITDHLAFKFILALEGNDVATNLKWIMSSNSIAVMPKPKYETWFMEGVLIPDKHYICIADDFSDLEEKLNYYIENTEEAEEIIHNAHQYLEQFRNEKLENQISLLVLDRYFKMTNPEII